jgi:hypothetical protein
MLGVRARAFRSPGQRLANLNSRSPLSFIQQGMNLSAIGLVSDADFYDSLLRTHGGSIYHNLPRQQDL